MCRFALYMGAPITISAMVTDPSHSIVHQSYLAKEREEPLNGDGFGVAWYAPEITGTPGLFKDISPAWNNPNLHGLAKVIKSGCILAHVRAATGGTAVNYANCHPFTAQTFSFMHNGVIGEFPAIKRRLRRRLSDTAYNQISGSTDSEHAFALMLDHYHAYMRAGAQQTEAMAEAMRTTIADIESLKTEAGVHKPSLLNFVLCDGNNAVISRYSSGHAACANTLYYWQGRHNNDKNAPSPFEDCDDAQRNALVVASEPLTQDNHWVTVPPDSLLIISDLTDIKLERITAG